MSDETFIAQSNFIFENKSKEYKDMNLGIDRMSLAITAMGDPCKETPAIGFNKQTAILTMRTKTESAGTNRLILLS